MPLLNSAQIGLNIKKARRIKSAQLGFGFTRKMLADALEEPIHIINFLESGRYYPDFEHIKKTAKICGVSIEYLVGENFDSLESYLAAVHQATKDVKTNRDLSCLMKTDPY
ncbi:helix-turn-helix transcriptional regulator [Peptococcaceae bacterium 1198_IL3148]